MDKYSTLFLIPARGGSKGIPHKNIRLLNGKPLIYYTLEVAKEIAPPENICVSTDDEYIINSVSDFGIEIPFVRPAHLATDEATTNDVIIHALNCYKDKGRFFDRVVLLQPTSPLRTAEQIEQAMCLYSDEIDMVVGVKEVRISSVLRVETQDGFLEKVFKEEQGIRRQDVKPFYEINGAIYVINTNSLMKKDMSRFQRVKKYIMSEETSMDIDTMDDWNYCEYLLNKNVER